MADISHLLGESFKEEESNLVTQSLSKIFLLNRLWNIMFMCYTTI